MVGTFQPLVENQKIVTDDGRPTEYFIRFIQQKQDEIGTSITEAQAEAIAIAEIETWAAARDINAGVGLSGGGNLSADRTIDLENTAVTPGSYTNTDLTVDAQGRITAAANGSGGGGGGYGYELGPGTVPAIADFDVGWIAQGSSTIADSSLGLDFRVNSGSVGNPSLYMMTAPAAPYTVYYRASLNYISTAGSGSFAAWAHGLVFRDGTNGDFVVLEHEKVRSSSNENAVIKMQRWANPTSGGAVPWSRDTDETFYPWMKADVTSTTISPFVSIDGETWYALPTETIASYVGSVTQIGIYARGQPAALLPVLMKVNIFGTTAPA